jgi:hypothetical protein
MGSFACGLVAAVSEVRKNTLQRLGGQGGKHGHLLQEPCDRCLVIFNFRVPLENSHYAVSDNAARDLVSSYFRSTWRVDPQGLLRFRSSPSPPPPTSGYPPGYSPGRYPGTYCASNGG